MTIHHPERTNEDSRRKPSRYSSGSIASSDLREIANVVTMSSEDLNALPSNRAIVLRNLTCPYCNADLTSGGATKEHVVGRCFVPKGMLDKSWNLILRACEPCNRRKGVLENDISAITRYTRRHGRAVLPRRAASPVKHAEKAEISYQPSDPKACRRKLEHRIKVKLNAGQGLAMTFDLEAPPQVDSERIFELSRGCKWRSTCSSTTLHIKKKSVEVISGRASSFPIMEAASGQSP